MASTRSMTLLGLVAIACGTGTDGPQGSTRSARAASTSTSGSVVTAANPSGVAQTINVSGGLVIDRSSPFFQSSLGTNGRSCSTCHVAADNMTVVPADIQARFDATGGTDPIFRPNDGATSPLADVSTVDARRTAYALLLAKGLIRVGIGIPAGAEFALVSIADPYGFASASELSLFRRPLAATNLNFLSTVMWDGRETIETPLTSSELDFDLGHQANSATLTHAQGTDLDDATKSAIVAYETQLFTAQVQDASAKLLTAAGATGGPQFLSTQPFTYGMNDGASFDPTVMTDYTAWSGSSVAARAAIARGEDLFNHKPIAIAGVSGLSDRTGTCSTCHDTPNAGNHSVVAFLRIGTDAPAPVGGLDVKDLPVYTLQNATGETQTTTDPGRALITGRWKDIGRFKGPTLRGLAGRAPYFHNGSASTLAVVVDFYDARFAIGFTDAEKADLVAFLGAL